jgi:AmiR/NasT family two-component response regulator
MANLPDSIRVAVIAEADAAMAPAVLELERQLIDHVHVHMVRFEHATHFLMYMQDLISLPPHVVLIASTENGLACLEQVRQLETGRTLPVVMLANDWTPVMLKRASQNNATSCVGIPDDATSRLEVFAALVRYWCSINEPAN